MSKKSFDLGSKIVGPIVGENKEVVEAEVVKENANTLVVKLKRHGVNEYRLMLKKEILGK